MQPPQNTGHIINQKKLVILTKQEYYEYQYLITM